MASTDTSLHLSLQHNGIEFSIKIDDTSKWGYHQFLDAYIHACKSALVAVGYSEQTINELFAE